MGLLRRVCPSFSALRKPRETAEAHGARTSRSPHLESGCEMTLKRGLYPELAKRPERREPTRATSSAVAKQLACRMFKLDHSSGAIAPSQSPPLLQKVLLRARTRNWVPVAVDV